MIGGALAAARAQRVVLEAGMDRARSARRRRARRARRPASSAAEPAGAHLDVVVDEHEQVAAGGVDAGVARGVQAARGGVRDDSARRGARRPRVSRRRARRRRRAAPRRPPRPAGRSRRAPRRGTPPAARVGTMMLAVGPIRVESLGLPGRDPLPAQPLPHDGRRGARRRRPAVARARAPRRGRAAARARQRGARPRRAPPPACCAAAWSPSEVGAAVRSSGARIVHAHNLNPTLGWRALAAARAAGARTVLHLHNYRLVCAVGTCFTRGADCTRCHGRDTRPGVRLNCRGTGAEAAVYGASLALWQRRLVAHADAVVVPSAFAGAAAARCSARRSHRRRPRCTSSATSCATSSRARRRRTAATRSSSRGWRPRRASTSRSPPAPRRGVRARRSPATGRC